MACALRKHPLRRPPNHKPPVPRWQLVLPDNVTRIFTAYIGIQPLDQAVTAAATAALHEASRKIDAWLAAKSRHVPQAVETFDVERGDDVQKAKVWVCYWDDETLGKLGLQTLDLLSIYNSLPDEQRKHIGLWSESFSTLRSRLETNYTGVDYLPGVAKLHGTSTKPHTRTAYWGAARDRIPDSAHDLFEKDTRSGLMSNQDPVNSVGKHLVGTNYDNMVHIRSGQFWETCEPEEAASYEELLEPSLLKGLQYLWENREASGAVGLRYLRNTDGTERALRETCGAGFFCSLGNLEDWAKKHPSHVAIYAGAMRHARRFGAERRFRTWHEVSVLKEGEAAFEYVNCLPGTGGIGRLKLREVGEV